jgi:hypothetical protein
MSLNGFEGEAVQPSFGKQKRDYATLCIRCLERFSFKRGRGRTGPGNARRQIHRRRKDRDRTAPPAGRTKKLRVFRWLFVDAVPEKFCEIGSWIANHPSGPLLRGHRERGFNAA